MIYKYNCFGKGAVKIFAIAYKHPQAVNSSSVESSSSDS